MDLNLNFNMMTITEPNEVNGTRGHLKNMSS